MHYPGIPAKLSVIERDQLLSKKIESDENHYAKHVFYPRNLNIKDIEGTEVGSLNTKFMKNWQLAQDLKNQDYGREKMKVDLHYPYGDGFNGEEAMPEYLKHARTMAGKNRNKLRLINNMRNGSITNGANSQSADFRSMVREGQFIPAIPARVDGTVSTNNYGMAEHLGGSLDKQYTEGRVTYEKLRSLNYQNSPINYENNKPEYELPSIKERFNDPRVNNQHIQHNSDEYMKQRSDFMSQPNLRRNQAPVREDGRSSQLPTINQRITASRDDQVPMSKEEYKLMMDIAEKERHLRELDERIRIERESIEAMSGPKMSNSQVDPYSNGRARASYDTIGENAYDMPTVDINPEMNGARDQNSYQADTQQLHKSTDTYQGNPSSMRQRPDKNPYNQYIDNQLAAGWPNVEHTERVGIVDSRGRHPARDNSPNLDAQGVNLSRDVFRSTDEFQQFNRYAIALHQTVRL